LRKISIILLSVISAGVSAQVLLPTSETGFERQHNFNPSVIAANGIRRIVYEIIDKKDFEIAIDKNLVETYEFGQNGLLQRYYYTVVSKCIERQVTGRRESVLHQ
jgi:hypothetical protein